MVAAENGTVGSGHASDGGGDGKRRGRRWKTLPCIVGKCDGGGRQVGGTGRFALRVWLASLGKLDTVVVTIHRRGYGSLVPVLLSHLYRALTAQTNIMCSNLLLAQEHDERPAKARYTLCPWKSSRRRLRGSTFWSTVGVWYALRCLKC